MNNEKAIDVLNPLITINNDRIEGYETASKETDELDLKSLFAQFISSSQACKRELINEVVILGGEVAEGTLLSGKFYRLWMDAKAALTGKDRKAILNSCEYGEDVVSGTYDKALESGLECLSAAQQTMVMKQKILLKADHDYVKALRDALTNA